MSTTARHSADFDEAFKQTQTVVGEDDLTSYRSSARIPPVRVTEVGRNVPYIRLHQSAQVSEAQVKVEGFIREQLLQSWEGRVISFNKVTFRAWLVDVTAGSLTEEEEVDLPIEDLLPADLELLVEGAVFHWVIGYRLEQGQKSRFSRIHLRRLPVWTSRDIQRAKAEAHELAGIFAEIND